MVGGGFGGLRVVKALRDAPVEVTLVDCNNYHLFQPLTYQVATGALASSDVTYPLRVLFGAVPNITVLLAAVTGFELDRRRVLLADDPGYRAPEFLEYDTLVVATGSSYTYFGHDEWREVAGEVKSLQSAVSVRSRVLGAFERAEATPSHPEQEAELTFVVVGGGPTGVEIAGQIGELARDTLEHDFKHLQSRRHAHPARRGRPANPCRVPGFPGRQGRGRPAQARGHAHPGAHGRGHRSRWGRPACPGRVDRACAARTVIWAAGVRASGLAAQLGEQTGAEVDKAGRVTVEPDLTLPGHPEVIALGDMARVSDGHGGIQDLPGLAPVAIQQGAYAARLIKRRLRNQPTKPFRYVNKGNLATIGRGRAVADLGIVRLSGLPAWLIWLGVHIFYLIGHQNRLVVMLRWSISFLTRGRAQGSRIITDRPLDHRKR